MAAVRRLSTHDIMRVSRDIFNKLSSVTQRVDLSTIQKFLESNQFGLPGEQIKDVELAVLLISSAHEANNKHFDDARKLFNLCDFLSSCKGNSVQRVVHYFTKALQARISRQAGMISPESEEKKLLLSFHHNFAINPRMAMSCARLPCIQVAQFAAVQAVLDSLASAKKVHIVDLAIRSGDHFSVLMQALKNRHECPVELLKITAVGISEAQKKTEEVGKWLTSFADTLQLPFQFNTAAIVAIKDRIFETSDDEVVAVFSLVGLRFVELVPDHCLESLLTVLRTLNPCAFVIVEPEASHSLGDFMERFLYVLMSYSASYDYIEDYIGEEEENRLAVEAMLGHEIKDIVAARDEDRVYRHMTINEWRDYFAGFGMLEAEVGISSFDQAMLLVKSFECSESCLLVRNGKCIVIGWKGIPLLSVSAWKFQQGVCLKGSMCELVIS